jgi:glycosyltransferase involved in cell wall biosynthesis
MRYDVVVATRNRADSLAACLSLIERQTELPVRVVVVDSSDDHDASERVLSGREPSVEWVFIRSATRSAPYQRNLGIAHAESDVVLVPDDDSMLFPGTAAEIMALYRADTAGQVAAVSAAYSDRSPLSGTPQQIRWSERRKQQVEPLRDAVERAVVPKPFETYPRQLWRSRTVPEWIDGERFSLVPSVGGYRLSLRTAVAQEHPFDETMGYGIGYALHEDMELSMRLQRLGYLLAAAERAPVFHDVHPGRRAGGFDYGFFWIANYIYACRANMPEGSLSWSRHLPAFLRYKIGLYAARAAVHPDSYNREVVRGARCAWQARSALMDAAVDDLPAAYRGLCDATVRKQAEDTRTGDAA